MRFLADENLSGTADAALHARAVECDAIILTFDKGFACGHSFTADRTQAS
jgi:hypothetical protein